MAFFVKQIKIRDRRGAVITFYYLWFRENNFLMRKWLKIKASVLGIAWLVIFLHDAIPHNHNNGICGVLTHEQPAASSQGEHNAAFNAAHHHNNRDECNFSANLFTKHSVDNIVAVTGEPGFKIYLSACCNDPVSYTFTCPTSPVITGCSLRAPPALI